MIVRGILVFATYLLGALCVPEETPAEGIQNGPAGATARSMTALLPMASLLREAEASITPRIIPVSSLARSGSDRPDDFTGYQIHVMYVVPSDGIDDALDTNGMIASSVSALQTWFVNQTRGLRLMRFDTSEGALDVTFFRLARTDAEIASAQALLFATRLKPT